MSENKGDIPVTTTDETAPAPPGTVGGTRRADLPEPDEADIAAEVERVKEKMEQMGVPDEQRAIFESVYNKIAGKREITDAIKAEIIEELNRGNIRKEHAGIIFEGALYLDDGIKGGIVEALTPMTPEEVADETQEVPQEEVERRVAQVPQVQALQQQAEAAIGNLADEGLQEEYTRKMNGIITKFKDFFDPEMPGGEFARWAGKKLYWALIIAFILFVAELNLINKAAGKRG